MAGIVGRLVAFARTPQGQRVITTAARKAQQMARDPKTQARIADLRNRATRRGSGGSGGYGGPSPR
ncbi:hypothetical protein [Quadrisphaera sp. DSM 44207]|uniref:hypothetical protein n=1 Tax=Quadrisphaera sp. DSM 44207 TaxID=1881057 RepID=UPI0008864B0E|nr:hypothetical protein [Quadrisphaera sp. DSM 44207]SDQ76959.1 hypothetical protein SAMN05428996_2737 [Quadrisphaera sp. DSM 44207]